MTGLQIALPSGAFAVAVAPPALKPGVVAAGLADALLPQKTEAPDGFGFHTALLRRASGHALAFVWLTQETRARLPRGTAGAVASQRLAGRLADLCLIEPPSVTPLLIADLHADARTRDLPMVTGAPHLTAFARFALKAPDGTVLGLACIADPKPRHISDTVLQTLRRLVDDLAAQLAQGLPDRDSAPHHSPPPEASRVAPTSPDTTTSCDDTQGRHGLSAMLMQWRDTLTANLSKSRGYLRRMVVRSGERRHNLGKIEAIRRNARETAGSRRPDDKGTTRPEGERAVASRLSGAVLRAILVMALVAMPSALLPGVTKDAQQMAALVALFAGAMTFVEYNAVYPGLIEFRHAPPYNRTRFALLVALVLLLCLIERGKVAPTALTQFLDAVGALVGWAMDFPYSPVRLATLMLDGAATAEQVAAVRTAAGMALLVTMVTLVWFVLTMRAGGWPSRRAAFNVWVNLPTFDPTVGADIIRRLDRDARVNVALGFLLPFLIPAVVRIATSGLQPLSLTAPQTLVWAVTIWAFLPASLFMRGIAMARVAQMIREKRQAAAIGGTDGLLPA